MADIHVADNWWETRPGDAHGKIFEVVRDLEQRQNGQRQKMQEHLGLYLDREINDFSSVVRARTLPLFGDPKHLNLNVVRSCVDTVKSKIVSHRPRPMFLTIDGRFDDRKKAMGLERWVDGLFYRERLHTEHAPQVFLDAAVFGTGALKIYPDPDVREVRMEWTWIGHLLLDEVSSLFAPPRVLFQKLYVSRDVLLHQFPDKENEISGVPSDVTNYSDVQYEDIVEVVEAWHLPSGPKAKDGRHIIAIESACLVDEEYKESDFPFVFFRWSRPPMGFYGTGLAEELHGLQTEIKKLLTRIQDAMHLTATAIIMKPRSTKIPDDHFTNQPGIILEYDGPNPPRWETPASMNSQVFQHMWRLRDAAYEIAGISQLSASATKPAGIESGVALRTLNDFETQRFALLSRDWEEFFLNAARKAVDLARKVHVGAGGRVKWTDRNIVKDIDWSDVNLREDSYLLQIYPTNMLPQTPSGKLATVEQMMQMGMLGPEEGRSLLDFPDLEKITNLATAAHDDLMYIFDSIWEGKEYIGPTPEMYLEHGIKMATSYWLRAHKDQAPEHILDLYVNWIEEAKELLAPPPEAAPMPGAPGEVPPEGLPPEGMPPEGLPPEALAAMGGAPPAPMASPGEAAAGIMAPPAPPVEL